MGLLDGQSWENQHGESEPPTSYIQKIVDSKEIEFGFELTVKVAYIIPKGYSHMSPEQLSEEWFSDKFSLNLRTNGHAFRDGSLLGNSEEIQSVNIIKKTVK